VAAAILNHRKLIIQKQLHEAGIPTIVIGGIAVGAWGEPRLTRDFDLKVLIGRDEADRLISQLSAPQSARAGRTKSITVAVKNTPMREDP
jgi:hypothetical protein